MQRMSRLRVTAVYLDSVVEGMNVSGQWAYWQARGSCLLSCPLLIRAMMLSRSLKIALLGAVYATLCAIVHGDNGPILSFNHSQSDTISI